MFVLNAYSGINFLVDTMNCFSAILSAGAPNHAAFMADESMAALPGLQQPIKYDLNYYMNYMKLVKGLVKELNQTGELCDRLNFLMSDFHIKPHIKQANILCILRCSKHKLTFVSTTTSGSSDIGLQCYYILFFYNFS